MSVQMTSAGSVGWYADRTGYRYAPKHPSGTDWPAIPSAILDIWARYAGVTRLPDSCLVNFYREGAKMGMHQDKDEADFQWPVLSLLLGDSALFRIGNTERGGKTESIWLQSGDVVVMRGAARLAYHGIDRVRFGSSKLLAKGGADQPHTARRDLKWIMLRASPRLDPAAPQVNPLKTRPKQRIPAQRRHLIFFTQDYSERIKGLPHA